MNLLITGSITFGLAYALIMSVVVLISMKWNIEIWYDDFPPETQKLAGPMSDKAKLDRKIFTPLFAVLLLGLPAIALFLINSSFDDPSVFSFSWRALSVYIIMGIFYLADLVLIDWLLGMVIDPKWLYLPGTEQGPNLWSIKKHSKDFLKAMLTSILIAPAVAGISLLFF